MNKTYFPCTNGQELEVHLYYNRDGRQRGYYLHVMPVTRGNGFIKTEAFTGEGVLLKEVGRKSVKAEREAIEIAAAHFEKDLIKKVLEKNELALLNDLKDGIKL